MVEQNSSWLNSTLFAKSIKLQSNMQFYIQIKKTVLLNNDKKLLLS